MNLKILTILLSILTLTACSSDPEYSVKQLTEDDALFKKSKLLCEDGTYSPSSITCQNIPKAAKKRIFRVN